MMQKSDLTEDFQLDLFDAFTILTHVATQLSSRWLPLPRWTKDSYRSYTDTKAVQLLTAGKSAFDFQIADWEDLIVFDHQQTRSVLTFFTTCFQQAPHFMFEVALAATEHLRFLRHAGGGYILINHREYPPLLSEIARPPLMLSYLGEVSCLRFPSIAVIGSRQASFHALRETMLLGSGVAQLPYSVVSGGAIGCDIMVHQGMLAAKNSDVRAVVVFAGGLSSLYPQRHSDTFARILAAGGVLMSERLWWQSSKPRDFPIRNRIVSGMALATVVMQAGDASGALITANEALEQGRDVFVLEHETSDVRAAGSIRLLQDGAVGFRSHDELLRAFSGDACELHNSFMDRGLVM